MLRYRKILCVILSLLMIMMVFEASPALAADTTYTAVDYYALSNAQEEEQSWGFAAVKKLGVVLFWILSCTWGGIATLAGAVMALICLKDGLEPKYFHGHIYFENVRERGSNNLGPFFFLGEDAEYYTPYHEAGHGLQNIVMGPFYVVVVGISSEIWYQKFIREYADELASGTWDPDERRRAYDRNPIERWATSWGAKAYGLELD